MLLFVLVQPVWRKYNIHYYLQWQRLYAIQPFQILFTLPFKLAVYRKAFYHTFTLLFQVVKQLCYQL